MEDIISNILGRLKPKDQDKVEEYLRSKLAEFADDVGGYLNDKFPDGKKSKSKKPKDLSLINKLGREARVVNDRLKRLKIGSYKDLRGYVESRIARMVDILESLVDDETIGPNEYNVYVDRIEKIFNGQESSFTMDGVRMEFEKFLILLEDEIGIEEVKRSWKQDRK